MILRRKTAGTDTLGSKALSQKEKRRTLRHELLEDRRLLAVGPQLLGVDHNNGVLIQDGSIHNTAPRELTFRFDEGQVLDRATLGGIRLIRSGLDGVFDNGNDVAINPAYLDFGQSSFNVVMRFNQTLVDDMYRIEIVGQGTDALRNTGGMAFGDRTMDNVDNGQNFSSQFDLQLGAQVISVVPQPVTRDPATGVLTQAKNKVEVYFNNDTLNATSASTPAFYRLIDTQDQSLLFPQSVAYDAVANVAVLTFASDLSTGTFNLQIGQSDEGTVTAGGAVDLGTVSQQSRAATYDSPVLRDINGNVVTTPIPDNGMVISAITVADSFLISDLNVELDIDHTWGPDLRIFLTGPAGQRVELIRDAGSQVRSGQIYGVSYSDVNENGIRDAAEAGRSGWTIFIDSNGNGELDAGERSTVTDSQGRYSFLNLDLGRSYKLVEIPRPFTQPTSPLGGANFSLLSTDFSNGGQQTLTIIDSPTSGTFRLSFSGRSTLPINFAGPTAGPVTAANIQLALANLVDPGIAVAVTSVSATQFTIAFSVNGVGTPVDHPALTALDNQLDVGQLSIANTADAAGFTSVGTNNLWHISSGRGNAAGHSPEHSFYFGRNETATGGGTYVDNADGTLRSPEIDLTDPALSGLLNLKFNHLLSTASLDFAEVRVVYEGKADVLLRTSASTSGFVPVELDLSRYLGKRIVVEFNFQSNGSVVQEGWYVDDIRVEQQRPAQTVFLGTGPQQQVLKDINFGSSPVAVVGPDAFGYQAYDVTVPASPQFEDITATGKRILQQFTDVGYAVQVGSGGDDVVSGMARDAAGNLLIAGSFQGTVDFDPGAGSFPLTSSGGNDIFVAKYAADGTFLWAKRAGGTGSDVATSVAVDSAGNVLVSGSYSQAADIGGTNLTSNGSSDAFVWKLNSSGNSVWARGFGGSAIDGATGIDVTSNGDVVATGFFSGTVDFDPTSGVQSQTSAGSTDAFVMRLSVAAGNLVWVRQMGGTGADRGEDVDVTPAGNITTTGSYSGTVDFNPGGGTNNLISSGSTDGFIQQLTSAGNYVWAQRFGSAATADRGNDVTSDASNNVYVTGVSNNDIWVRRLTANGGTTWTKTFGGNATDIGESIEVAVDGSVLVGGSYRGTVNFGGGNQVAAGGSDGFLLSLNGQGNYTATNTFGGTLDDSAFGAIREDADSYLFAGSFRGAVTFDVGTSTQTLTSAGGSDAFFARAATVIGLDDGAVQLTPADLNGFQFDFYGTVYDALFVSTNGLISFGGPNASSANTDLLGAPTEPTIAAFWEDLRTGAADFEAVFWQVFGTGTDQRLVVQWSNVQVDNANGAAIGPLDFQAVLYERDGSIQFNYRSVADPQIIAAGPEQPVGTFTKGSQTSPAIASDAAGNYVVVWNSSTQDGDQLGIYGRRFNAAGNPLGAEFPINETTVGDQTNPQVAMNSAGRFVVTWEGAGTGDTNGVFARVYTATGTPLTGEFAVPAELTGTQSSHSVGIDNTGNFVIAWSGVGQEDFEGVYARRFNSAGQPAGTVDEVQRIRFLGPPAPSSTFTLVRAGVETAAIAIAGTATGTAANIRDALRALSNTDDLLTVTALPNANEVQTLDFTGGPASGTVVLGFNGLDTAPITFAGAGMGATTATNIQTALTALIGVGAGNVTVTPVTGSDTRFTATFTGALAGADQPLIVLRTNSLNQGSLTIAETTAGSTLGQDFEVTFLGTDGATNQPLLSHGLNQNGVTHLQFTTRREGSNGQFRVNSFLTGTQSGPRVDMAATGDFNISWTSANQDGSLSGVFAKRFDSSGVAITEEFDEVQRLTLNGPPNLGSTYRLRMGGPGAATTGFITYAGAGNGSQSAANIQAALRGLPNLGTVTVEALPGTSNEVQLLNFTGFPLPQIGTIRLAHRGIISAPITFAGNQAANAAQTATNLQDALRLITGSTTLTVVPAVVGGANDPFRFIVTFLGAPVAAMDQPPLVLVDNQLNQGTVAVNTISDGGKSDNEFVVNFNGSSGRVDQPTLQLALNTGGVASITVDELTRGVNSEFQVNTEITNNQNAGDTIIRPDGSTFYVWQSTGQDGDANGIFGKLYGIDGSVLREEFRINTFTQSSQFQPRAGVDANGNLVVVWSSIGQDGDSTGVYARRLGADAFPLGDEFQVHTLTAGAQTSPVVTVNPNGSFVVAWQTAAGQGGIHSQRYDAAGVKLSSEAQVSQYGLRDQSLPEIARAANGNYVIVWEDSNRDPDNSSGIYGQVFAADGTPLSGEFAISSADLTQTLPAVDMDANGNFVVVWSTTELDANNNSIQSLRGRRFDAAGNPLAAEFVVATNVLTSAAVDINPTTGDFVIVWKTGVYAGQGELHGRVFDASGTAKTADLILSSSAETLDETPVVAMQANGQFMVAQMEFGGPFFVTSAQPFAANGVALAPAFNVSDIEPADSIISLVPDIAVDTNGKYSIVWYSFDLNSSAVDAHLRQFDATGTAVGPSQQLNAVSGDSNNLWLRVSIAPDNSLVTTWVNEAASTGVLVQRVDASGKLVGANTPIGPTGFRQNSPVVAAANGGAFTVAWVDDRLGQGIFQQSFTSDLASVGIKAAGPQMIGGNVLPVWVDGTATSLVDNGRSVRIARVQQPLGRLFAVDATNNQLLELNSASGATLKSYPLPVPAGPNAGLAFAGGTVYYIPGNGSALYELDPDTGGTVEVMPLSGISTSGLSGLAYLNGEVVLLDTTANELIFVDPFRNSQLRRLTPATAVVAGLVGGGERGTLFGINAASQIVEINATTGAVVATLPSPGGNLVGLALVDGRLLASNNAGAVFQLDPDTGAVSGSLTTAPGLAALGADGGGGMAAALGGDYQPFTGTILDDEASLSITEGVGPYSGRYRPADSLTAFDGTNSRGDWQLEVRDTATGNTGVFNGWRLRFNEAQDTPPDTSYTGYIGDTLSPTTTAVNDVDLYRFNVVQGGEIAVTVKPTAGLDAVVRLFDAQGNPLTLVNAAGPGGVERLVYTATSAGVYFVGVSSAGNASYNIVDGSGAANGSSQGSYALEVDFSAVSLIDDNNSSFDTATTVGVIGQGGQTIRSEVRSGPYGPELPGAINEPGHRDIPPETHLEGSSVSMTTAFYNFQDVYGVLPSGATAVNAITEIQKQRAREVFEMYSQHLGIQFIETANEGLTVATGDLRAIDPTVPGGPGGVAGISEGTLSGRVIMDAAENWGNSEYGGAWFQTAMHEIGHSLGMGHSYELPNLTIQGSSPAFPPGEPVFPGDADLIHGKYLHKPASIDQDLYKFTLNQDGTLTAETVAERIALNASLLDTVITIYRETAPGRREIVASNDDYFSNDSYLRLHLTRGTYYISVSASGNKGMDPAVSDTGFGGTSQGDYELKLDFKPDVTATIKDTDNVAIDGDSDGVPGGTYSFFFESGPTIFVDKMADTTSGVDGDGSLATPFDNIAAATERARSTLVMPRDGAAGVQDGESFIVSDGLNPKVRFEFDSTGSVTPGSVAIAFTADMSGQQLADAIAAAITATVNSAGTPNSIPLNVTATAANGLVRINGTAQVDASGSASLLRSPNVIRILGNGGTDGITSTLADNRPFLLGIDGTTVLADGGTLEVPQGVTVMVDAGALFKLREANFDVGTSLEGVDRRHGALQILGTPTQHVSFYSYRNDSVGGDSDGPGAASSSGDWGGLVFRSDSDFEQQGIFLNWVNNATIVSGGGKLLVGSVEETFAPIHLVGSRPTISSNTIRRSADAAISANPASFSDADQRIGPDIHSNLIIDNSINGLFVRIRTELGQTVDKISIPSRWDDTDIVHVLTENLQIEATPGGPVKNPVTGVIQAQLDGSLKIDPGVIVKLAGARIETLLGAQLIAEGTAAMPIVFTTLTNDAFGGSGTFDTKNDAAATSPAAGQWGGLIFNATAQGSLDHVLLNYGGGLTPIEGGFDRFNAIEIHQADVRLTNSIVRDNDSGTAATSRNGRGTNAAATVFVRGAQPTIVNNLFQNNLGTVIHINANSLQATIQADPGRSTGASSRFVQFADNYGPLIRLNRLQNNSVNGMEVRGAVLTTESVWDDTDIAHVLRGEIAILNHHTFSGLHLISSQSESLVVKLAGANAGFTANGTLLDIDDRIGGSIYIGASGLPVVLTSLSDDTAIAGVDLFGQPLGDTDNNGPSTGAPGNWRGILLDRYSNDRNVSLSRESEPAFSGAVDSNRTPAEAQFLGNLAPDEKSGDVNRRLGFEVHGNISVDNSRDLDVYSFSGVAGTEVFFDLDQTSMGLDSVLELIDATGTVLARSVNSSNNSLTGLAQPLLQAAHLGHDFYSITDRDPGMRLRLPGAAGQTNTYFVRVRSNPVAGDVENISGGLTRGDYKLQIRLRQVDEKPGSFIRGADIRFATNGIQVIGLPSHSPLIGESTELRTGNESLGAAQPLGNLLTTDRNTLSVGGELSTSTDVDWYRFELDYQMIQSIGGFNNGGKSFATIFDIDYADGLGRPDTVISVFDAAGNLILVSRDSNIEDDQPRPGQGSDAADLSRGSFGTQDAYIGSVHMPAGVPGSTSTYFVAVSSNSQLPTALNGTFTSGASNTLVRLEPISSLERIAEDHIGFQGYTSGNLNALRSVPPRSTLFNISNAVSLSTNVVPFTLNDVVLYTAQGGTNGLKTINPFTGAAWTNVGNLPVNGPARTPSDLVMRSDGRLFMVQGLGGAAGQNTAGQLVELDPATGAQTVIGTDGIPDINAATNPPNLEELTSPGIDALAWQRTGNVAEYNLYYSVQGARRGPGVDSATSTLYRADPANGSAAVAQGQPWGRRGEIYQTTPGDLGRTTGMAFMGNTLYGVSNQGFFYEISLASGRASNVVSLGTSFSGLAIGPQNLQGGAFANLLFATASNGQLMALNTSGTLQPVFNGGATSVNIGTSPIGLAFSVLDFNLWHPTEQRSTDAGHGINRTFDNTRPGSVTWLRNIGSSSDIRASNETAGGLSFRFGFENWAQNPDTANAYLTYGPNAQYGILAENTHRDLAANPALANNYNFPGGALGSLATRNISLSGYSEADKPTLYFNYFLETENQNTITTSQMRDSARVLVSPDGGNTWELLATNNSILSNTANIGELPRFISPNVEASTHPRQQVQELFDNTGGWRQARVDLSNYAGVAQLQFRFDFSTAGALPSALNSSQIPNDPNIFGNLRDAERGRNNSFEGFYVDDIIVGFSERGEMVTNAGAQSDHFTIPQNPDPADPSQILVGQYQLEVRRGTEYAQIIDNLNPDLIVGQPFDTNTRLVPEFFRLGDRNLPRDQGQVLISNNTISNSLEFGIIVDAGNRDAGGSLAHPGSVRNLPTINNDRLTGGVKVENNVVANFGQGGIRFSGDPNTGTQPLASVPFGRIMNNTVYGGQTASGAGIQISDNASPTVINNIIANTATGLTVDASSAGTVVGANLFQGNTSNGTLGENAIVLPAGAPLFVNAALGNFYLAQGSFAIDSSLNSLADRPSLVAVNAPLGIPVSPILAPERDRFGQLRLDDPAQDPPPGLGSNIFKDRGAIERADFRGPTARLIEPSDNDGLGLDLNPLVNEVLIQPTTISQIVIQLVDQGIGIDDNSVTAANVQLRLDGVLLVPGTDYEFVYNATNNLIILRALKNNGPVSNRYDVRLINTPATGIRDLASNAMLANLPSGNTDFVVITGGQVGNNTLPDFTIAMPTVTALEDNERELGITTTEIPNFATNLPPMGGIGDPVLAFALVSNSKPSLFSVAPAIDRSGKLTFVTAADQVGSAVVVMRLTETGVSNPRQSAPQTFTISLTPVNDAPFLSVPNRLDVNEDQGLIQIAGFAVDLGPGPVTAVDESAQTLSITTTALNPGFFSVQPTIDASGTLRFQTQPDFNSSISPLLVTVQVTDNGSNVAPNVNQSELKTFTIAVAPINDAPTFTMTSPSVTVFEDEEQFKGLTQSEFPGFISNIAVGPATATDEASQSVSFNVNTDVPGLFEQLPAIDASGKLTFKTAANRNGTATVVVQMFDSGPSSPAPNQNSSTRATFTIAITPVNDPPQFTLAPAINTLEDAGLQTVRNFASNVRRGPIGSDDENSQQVTFNVVADDPSAFSIQPAISSDGTLTYQTAANANSSNANFGMTVRLQDNGLGAPPPNNNQSAAQAFVINVAPVNDSPVPDAFTVTGAEDTSLNIVAAAVLAGDVAGPTADEHGQSLKMTQTETTTAMGGSVTATFDLTDPSKIFSLDYRPALNFTGIDTFRYVVTDNGNPERSGTGTITINVQGINDAPTFAVGANQQVNEDSPLVTVANWATGIFAGPASAVDELANQTVSFTVAADNPGMFEVQPAVASDGALSFKPAKDANGTVQVVVTAVDSGPGTPPHVNSSAAQTFTINIAAVNDAPAFTPGAHVTVQEDSGAYSQPWATAIAAAAGLTATPATAGDEAGQVVSFEATVDKPGLFAVQPKLNGQGQLEFTPAADAFGVAVVSVVAVDNGPGSAPNVNRSVARLLTITIGAQNDAPLAVTDSYATSEDAQFSIAAPGLLSNDTDVDMPLDTLTAVAGSFVSDLGATVTIAADGAMTYDTASVAAFQQLTNGQSISDTFVYKIRDAAGLESNNATVTIAISGVDDPPTAVDDNYSIGVGQSLALDVLRNDTDVDSTIDLSTVVIKSSPGFGTISVSANGLVTYTPEGGFRGNDSFRYTVKDSSGNESNEALVSLSINSAPTASNDAAFTFKGQPVEINVLSNDQDLDGTLDPTSVQIQVSPGNSGSVEVLPSGLIRFTPAADFSGDASFTYTVEDNLGTQSNAASVSVRVQNSRWQNPQGNLDINDDSFVSPIDVLLIINYLNSGDERFLPASGIIPAPYLDPTGDEFVSPLDVLSVINFLNESSGGGQAEGESSPATPAAPEYAMLLTPPQALELAHQKMARESVRYAVEELLPAESGAIGEPIEMGGVPRYEPSQPDDDRDALIEILTDDNQSISTSIDDAIDQLFGGL